jgi:hypothetical protein
MAQAVQQHTPPLALAHPDLVRTAHACAAADRRDLPYPERFAYHLGALTDLHRQSRMPLSGPPEAAGGFEAEMATPPPRSRHPFRGACAPLAVAGRTRGRAGGAARDGRGVMTFPASKAEAEQVNARIRQIEDDRRRALRERWDVLFAEWLENRALYMRTDADWDGRDEFAHGDRETELARLIVTTPAVYGWMVLRKIEVLEHYLGAEGETSWTDNREVVMLAAIKADLLRFKPGEREEGL